MAIFKCKMCGGDLQISDADKVIECEYCGTNQTVPSADNEKKLNLFNRANRLRINVEFDKATAIYESIVAEFPEEAEAYWGLVICNYGIEYVDDPATAKKIPTCHRASFESIQKDENFELALEYADVVAQKIYRDEAREIDRIREEILAVSKNEQPYDIFICYKETDENGERTVDSVIAQDVYDALTAKGYRVFFARISLEDKLGRQYEPYIFAALNSAKVMLSFGTKYEYFHAVWVKNEWSRFLKLMAKDKSKALIPCYKDMDAYDLPDEFKALQAQDMGKVGAIQDLLRGIEKIIPRETAKAETVIVQQTTNNPTIDSLLKRAFMFLEDGEWERADDFCEQVLNIDPECAEAYLGKLMAELHIKKQEDLKDSAKPFDNNSNYQKAIKFADSQFAEELESYNELRQNSYDKKPDIINKSRNRIKKFEKTLAFYNSNIVALCCDGTILSADDDIILKNWSDIVSISSSNGHILGLKSDGTVVASGRNNNGQCNVSKWANIIDICAGWNHSVGLKADGTVVAVGDNSNLQCNVSGWTNIVSIATEPSSTNKFQSVTYGLKEDGTVVCTSFLSKEAKDVIAFSNGCFSSIKMINRNGNVYCEKSNEFEQWSDIVSISSNGITTVGLKANGTVVVSGRDDVGNVSGWKNIVTVFTVQNAVFGVNENGDVLCTVSAGEQISSSIKGWTLFYNIDTYEQDREKFAAEKLQKSELLKQKTTEQSEKLEVVRKKIRPVKNFLAASCMGTTLLNSKGKVNVRGRNIYGEASVSQWKEITAISSGEYHNVGLKADGTVVAVGKNSDGQCNVSDWKDIVAVATGPKTTVGIRKNGLIMVAGYNYGGLSGWRDIVSVAMGEHHIVGLKKDGTVVSKSCYGDYIQIEYWKDIVDIAVSDSVIIGLKADGTLLTAGEKGVGDHISLSINNPEWKDIVAIHGNEHSLACLKADGRVLASIDLFYKNNDRNIGNWNDIVAVACGYYHIVGLKSDGTLIAEPFDKTKSEYGQNKLNSYKLFKNIETVEEEINEEKVRIEKERKERELEQLKADRRYNCLCQHCGGRLTGFFNRRCSSCGKPKDY